MWFGILFFGVIILYIIWGINYNVKKVQEEKIDKEKIEEKGITYNSIFSTEIYHISGLSLTENSKCILHLCENEIVVESTGEIIRLSKNKIVDMNIKTSKEVQNSISGAVGGAILLGPIGAFLGGSSTEFHRFFIIVYKGKDDTDKCISFDMKDDMKAFKEINDYIENYKNNVTQKRETEL